MPTKISWTERTWNVTGGCSKVSEGCQFCWAERLTATRFKKKLRYDGLTKDGKWAGKIKLFEDRLEQPLHWRKPSLIFVNSQSDLFHPEVPFEFIDKVMAIIALTPRHTYQILTKHADRMLEYCQTRTAIDESYRVDRMPQYYHVITDWLDDGEAGWLGKEWEDCERAAEQTDFTKPLSNLIGMVTAENQKRLDERAPLLLQCGFAKTGVSIEPMLTHIDFSDQLSRYREIGERVLPLIDWCIIGCESLPGGRAGRFQDGFIEAALDIVNQCKDAGVKVHVKQIPINGKVSKDPDEWPAELRIQEKIE